MSYDTYPEEEISELSIFLGHGLFGILLFFLVVVQVATYEVAWYFWVPLCLVLIARLFAFHRIGYSVGHAAGRKHHERISLLKSLGDFEPGEELQAFRQKHRELSSLYENSRYVVKQKCKEYDESYASWNQGAEKDIGDKTTLKNKNAWEELGDAVERCKDCKEALDKLKPEMERLEWEEKLAVSHTVKEMNDVECGVVEEVKS
jgi:hypothetical protein